MSSPIVAVLCTALFVLCVDGTTPLESVDHPQIVDSVKLVIVSKQDDDGKWVNEIKLEHGTELAPWKVEVEQKTLARGGQPTVELTATLTGPKPAAPTTTPREISEDQSYQHSHSPRDFGPQLRAGYQYPFNAHMETTLFDELRTFWRGSQYTVHTKKTDWNTANKTCTDAGSYLAIINSEEEATFFTRMLSQLPWMSRGAFVGITDEHEEGNWVTVEGIPISDAGFAQWFRNDQPDNANGNENCGLFFVLPRGLNDVPCTGYPAQFICEKVDEAERVEDPFGTSTKYFETDDAQWLWDDEDCSMGNSDEQEEQEDDEPNSDFQKFEGFSSLYKVHSKQMDWETANKTCVEEGSHLAVINSEDEAMMLASLLNRFYDGSYRGAFVGITDEAEEGTWLTIFGETTAEAGFARWFRDDQPDNANGNENCGAIFPANGGFNDVACTKYLMHSICEKDEDVETENIGSIESNSLYPRTAPRSEEIESQTETSPTEESNEIESGNELQQNETTRRQHLATVVFRIASFINCTWTTTKPGRELSFGAKWRVAFWRVLIPMTR